MLYRFFLPVLWIFLSIVNMYNGINDVAWILLVGAVCLAKIEVVLMKLEKY